MMEIFRILDEMEMLIRDSKRVPFSAKSVIEGHVFLDRLDRIRAILPEELQTAKLVLQEKERIVNEACAQAEEVMEVSKGQVARMLDENEITKNAVQIAEEIVANSENMAKEIRKDANEYALEVLAHMEIVLKKGLDAVVEGKVELNYALDEGDY